MTKNTRKYLRFLLEVEMKEEELLIEELQEMCPGLEIFVARHTTRLAELKKMYAEI